ncbi:aldehyde dehydrogenase family protein [Pseudomonas aeruginosa]|uniref:aldehyde dehydrogenase family protein n=1 Tax=Pseudomonas aeruginosa TaxID=287 RepID=UPI00071C1477|nr:aldehyde dehydrogenase family protein [Pseudomonas aeruginosa]KSQ25024.1 aldehyde dehydrogenase [Pseudomonas aeruginosa]MCO1687916.1 aldehyde dehydrogenase family protein [Pseudomonas aeruginosa]MCO1778582.1 aldehyde dehydrogenase family protein [Pseudomonas aeruginosa]MCO1790109.1 aldehyde dehydrogenase family protein [Pseudomonas aeruginosa]MCO1802413.1 aldehyde dehydrogenase family protein [Pseudomonas aeruginosa]
MSIAFTDIRSFYIDGEWVQPTQGYEPVINPATEEVIGEAPLAGRTELDLALAAARRAFDEGPWPQLPVEERSKAIRRLRAAIVKREALIKQLLTAEVGAVQMLFNSAQYNGALEAIDYAIQLALRLEPEGVAIELKPNPFDPSAGELLGSGIVVREPYGVVAGITPYNYPFLLNVVKAVPALLTGNTVVLKPSQFTPFSALLLNEIIIEAELPHGVLSVINGGSELGAMLSEDARVDLVTFTGSDQVGQAILRQSAGTLKKVHLELGGKSALIVRHDADIAKSAAIAAFSMSLHAGQGCALLTRYIVHNSIRPAFVEAVKATLGYLKIGDPADPTVVVGPLIRESARHKTERFVQAGLDCGATLVCGGQRPAHLTRGFFHEPTLFDNVDNASVIAQEEVFGPIGVVIGFDSDEEAIRLANASKFGLSGAVMSADRPAAFRMAMKLRTGGVSINGGTGDFFVKAPFGGYKHSGIGRELGKDWLKEFLLEKSITYPIG